MQDSEALRRIRAKLNEFRVRATTTSATTARLVRALDSILDDVDTQTGFAPAAASSPQDAAIELVRLGVLRRVCCDCGAPLDVCKCPPERSGTRLEVDSATLERLSLPHAR